MSPLGMSTTEWPTVPALDDMMSVEQSVEWQLTGETEVLGEYLPRATLSTTNPTWLDLGLNPSSRYGKPVNNRLSYGMAIISN
jgi:hypothetical protein